jgi:5-aminolevulinate synthase
MDLMTFYEQSIRDLRQRGDYRFFKQLQPDTTNPAIAIYTDETGRRSEVTVWCNNDYLGMSKHPDVIAALLLAVKDTGAGAGGVRSLSGTTDYHVELEHCIADLYDKPRALLFNSGFIANDTVLSTLLSRTPGMIAYSDTLIHASMIYGIRHAKCDKRIFRHNDPGDLDRLLADDPPEHPKLVVLESVYSMDGHVAPLPEIVRVAQRHGALVYLDEVHACGMYGAKGSGIAEEQGVLDGIDIIQGTLGKAYGLIGGYIAAPTAIVEFVKQFAPGLIFTTALPPGIAAAAIESIRILSRTPALRNRLAERAKRLKWLLAEAGLPVMESQSHIVPLYVGDPNLATEVCDTLLKTEGLMLQPIKFPTVAHGTERIRICPAPYHTDKMMDRLLAALQDIWTRMDLPREAAGQPVAPAASVPKRATDVSVSLVT